MRLHFLRAAAALVLMGVGGCAFEPRYPIEPGAPPGRGVVVDRPAYPIDPPAASPRAALLDPDTPTLMPAVDYAEAGALWTLASTRHPALRHRLEAEPDADGPHKGRRGSRAAKARSDESGASSDATVTVKAGDTLYSLAGRNHATVEAVARLNGLKPPYALAPGRTLKLPTPRTYVARKGDTVSAVTDRYGVKESLLRKANPDLSGDGLKRGAKVVLPAAAKDGGADTAAQNASPAHETAAAEAAAAPDAKACPKHKGRRACLAAAAAAEKTAAVARTDDAAQAPAFDLKACRRRHSRRVCAAQATAATEAAAVATRKDAAEVVAFDVKACRRRHSRRACAAQGAAATAAAVSSHKDATEVAAFDLKACRRHHGRRTCAAQAAAAKTEVEAQAPTATRKDAADAATAALNLKACRRRHSRRACAAQAAAATPDAEATVAAAAKSRTGRPAATPPPDAGVSAESMVASLPPASPFAGRTRTRLSAEPPASTPTFAAATPSLSGSARETASIPSGDSPGPRPYASVFGAGAVAPAPASGRRARDRSGRTSQDAQAAAAAAARRDYARASLPAAPLTGAADGGGRPRFAWPVSGEVISGFGPKGSGLRNDGVDLAASLGDPVKASAAGEVVYAGGAIPGFGNLVLVKHAGGYVTAYGHLSKISVAMRQAVRQGDVVGEAGQSGNVARPELHFEIRFAATPEENAKPVDPAPLLPRRG